MRIDKWLWAARFFKTRSLASQAIQGGHVHVNGNRVKSAHNIKVNDVVRIRKSYLEWTIDVLELASKRGPATQAQLLYQEQAASIAAREQLQLTRKQQPTIHQKPGKHDRKQLRDLKQQASSY